MYTYSFYFFLKHNMHNIIMLLMKHPNSCSTSRGFLIEGSEHIQPALPLTPCQGAEGYAAGGFQNLRTLNNIFRDVCQHLLKNARGS